jgi:hypothetical protein
MLSYPTIRSLAVLGLLGVKIKKIQESILVVREPLQCQRMFRLRGDFGVD